MDYLKLYTNFLKRHLKPKRKMKVVFDCSNGTVGLVLKELFRNPSTSRSDSEKSSDSMSSGRPLVFFINERPNGRFPAHGPNPLAKGATRQLEKEVKKQKADLGVIFDADGDRVFFVDNRGRWIDPNETAYILTKLFKPPYVVGIVSSWRLKRSNVKGQMPARQSPAKRGDGGSNVFISRVGHYFFKKLMREKKASLGVEHSGHFYFKKFFYADSGILAALEVINFVSELKTDLANWLDALPKYYRSGEINFEVRDKKKILEKIEKQYKNKGTKISKLDGLTAEFNWGWFNVRPSNTENLLRLNLETMDKKVLKQKLAEIRKLITNY